MISRTIAAAALLAALLAGDAKAGGLPAEARAAAQRVVKIYGAGGLGGIEAYQSGLIISAEGHIATANSLVLDLGEVTVILDDGARYSGVVVGADPVADVAVVKIDPAGRTLTTFSLDEAPIATPGEPVVVLANVFGIATGGEPVSIMHGVVAAVAPLRATRGPLERIDGGEVYILDAVTSNPGAAGGALVDYRGRLLGMLGRELKSRVTGAWLSYALPAAEVRLSARRIIQGHESAGADPATLAPTDIDLLGAFGFQLAPEIVARTPPYVDHVTTGSAAAAAGLAPDDLIITVEGLVTGSVAEVRRVLARESQAASIRLFLQRGDDFLEVEIAAPKNPGAAP